MQEIKTNFFVCTGTVCKVVRRVLKLLRQRSFSITILLYGVCVGILWEQSWQAQEMMVAFDYGKTITLITGNVLPFWKVMVHLLKAQRLLQQQRHQITQQGCNKHLQQQGTTNWVPSVIQIKCLGIKNNDFFLFFTVRNEFTFFVISYNCALLVRRTIGFIFIQ